MSNFSDKTQFDYLYDALAQKYPGIKNTDGRNTMFQFVTTPTSADWANGNDARAYNMANAVSKNLDGFYVHGDALDTSYIHLIQTVKPKSGDDNPRYREVCRIIGALQEEMTSIRNNAISDYNVWKANNSSATTGISDLTFNEWLLDDFGGSSWQMKIDQQKFKINDYIKEQKAILSTMDRALTDALDRIDDAKMDKMTISLNGQNATTVPKLTVGGDLAADKARWLQTPKGQYEFDVSINAAETITSPWKTLYDTKVDKSCFKLSIKTEVNTSRIIMDKSYNLNFRAVGINSYDVTRGKWYSPDFVRPDIQLVDGAAVTNDYFFSGSGVLHMIPNNILVMYRPEIELTISTDCYKETLSAYSDVNISWIEIFGFRMNFGAAGKLQPISKGDKVVIKIYSPENAVPQLVGVTSTVVYNGNK